MAISLIQPGSGFSSSGTSVTLTWTSATTSGNLLVAFVMTGQFASSLTAPSGWSSAVQKVAGSAFIAALFYKANAASQSSQVFTVPSGAATVVGLEYSGCATSSPLDSTGSGTTFGSSASVSNASATTQASEVWVFGAGVQSNSPGYGTPNNSFTTEATKLSTSGSCSSLLADKIVAATGTPTCAVSITSNNWIVLLATFKASAGGVTFRGSTLGLMGVG